VHTLDSVHCNFKVSFKSRV